MAKFFLILLLALFASVTGEPAWVYSGSFYTSPFASAALVAPAVAPAVAPITAVAPVASISSLPYTSLYGAAYSDYVSAYSMPYTLDWYYRK